MLSSVPATRARFWRIFTLIVGGTAHAIFGHGDHAPVRPRRGRQIAQRLGQFSRLQDALQVVVGIEQRHPVGADNQIGIRQPFMSIMAAVFLGRGRRDGQNARGSAGLEGGRIGGFGSGAGSQHDDGCRDQAQARLSHSCL